MRKKECVDLYGRVSTQEQALEGYSIGEQKERLEKYADAHGWIVNKNYSDAGYSGGNLNRPGLQALIRDAQHGKVTKVIVYKLDRLSRSQKDTLFLIEDVFLANSVDFVSMTENFDTSSPFGRAMIGVLSVFAQLEREQIKERMQIGLSARAKDGYYHGGPYAPIGYDYVDGELVINEYEAMQVRKIYDMYIDGMPVHSIYTYMLSRYRTKYGEWKDSSVRSCLSSVVYKGKISWKGEIYNGRHQAIIDEQTWTDARHRDDLRDKAGFRKHPFQRTTLLGGLLWCGNCGARYYCKQNTSKRPGITPAQRYYTCYSRGKTAKNMIRDPNCKNKSYNIKELDRMVLDEIRKLSIEPSLLEDYIASSRTVEPDNRAEIINQRLREIASQYNRLIDLYTLSGGDLSIIGQRMDSLTKEKESLEEELDETQIPEPVLSIEKAKEVLATFEGAEKSGDFKQLKMIIHTLIDGIVINGEKMTINWNFV